MITRLLMLLVVVATASLHAQVSAILPPGVRDSMVAVDARSPAAQRERQRNLDSLAAGRRRWAAAGVIDYHFQVHTDCFCLFVDDSAVRFPLAIVHNGRIVGRSVGKQAGSAGDVVTIDTLFAQIERDLDDPGRTVVTLRLDPQFGFPREYRAETPRIPDLAVRTLVDSFAIVRAGSRGARKPI